MTTLIKKTSILALCMGSVWALFLISKKPQVVCTKPHIELGEMKQGTMALAAFQVTNRSLQDVQLLAVKTSCTCILVKCTSTCIKSGDSETITLGKDTTGFSGRINGGAIVQFKQNGFARISPIQLSFVGTVLSALTLDRQVIDLGPVFRNQTYLYTVTANVSLDKSKSVFSVEAKGTSPFITVLPKNSFANGTETFLLGINLAHCPAGTFKSTVRFSVKSDAPGDWGAANLEVYANIL